MSKKTAEEIFDIEARKFMLQWNLRAFKSDYPRLYKSIISSINQFKEQEVKEVVSEDEIEKHCIDYSDPTGAYRDGIDKGIELRRIITTHLTKENEELREKAKDLLVLFLDELRDYIHESGNNLYTDERESKEFVDIFLTKHK